MKIGVLGSGTVGRTLAGAIAARGNEVMMGTRDVAALRTREVDAETVGAWAERHQVQLVPFGEAGAAGEVVFNATAGMVSVDVLRGLGDQLDGTILVDVANPLDFSGGMPPLLSVVNADSLAEQIQAALPAARVIKALNTVNAGVMVDPAQVAGGDHDLFICGNDVEAKELVARLLQEWFGWKTVRDLGDITAARAMEMYLPLWVRLMVSLGTPAFSIKVVQ